MKNIINHKKLKRHTEEGIINKFKKQLLDIALQSMEGLSDYGHKLIEVEEIGSISHVRLKENKIRIENLNLKLQISNQNKIEVTACRFNDLNQKREIETHPEKKISRNDFFVSFLCV